MVATVSHGIVYVVQRDRPSGSSFNKGDRVTMVRPDDKPRKSGEFMYEDGRRVHCPFVNAEDLTKARKKKLTKADIKPGVVYEVLADQADGSSFMKGDRIKQHPDRPGTLEFVREDGRTVTFPFIQARYLKVADKKEETKVTKKLTFSDLRHGVTYVTLTEAPSCSSFNKGDRIKLLAGSRPNEAEFQHEDGRRVIASYVNPMFLAIADEKEVPVTKTLTNDDIRFGQVYVVLRDQPNCSSFKKGDRIKLRDAYSAKNGPFVREDGSEVLASYVDAHYLAFADGKPVKLGEADVRHGQVYVVLKDKASCSDFKKGDRVKLRADTKPTDHHFVYEDGREVSCPYVWPEYLAFADGGKVVAEVVVMPKTATLEDLKPGAVFKVEGMTGYHAFPMGSIVQHTGEFSESARPRMQLLTLDGGGLKQYVHLQDITVVTEGKGAAVAPKPVKGSGKVVKTATRSDAYTFELRDCGAEGYMLQAGCRWFTMTEAHRHWVATRIGTDLGHETFDILQLFNLHIDRLNAAKKKGV